MSLKYRGQMTQPSATVQTIESGMTGQFLGRSFSIRVPQQTSHRSAQPLQYRGAIY